MLNPANLWPETRLTRPRKATDESLEEGRCIQEVETDHRSEPCRSFLGFEERKGFNLSPISGNVVFGCTTERTGVLATNSVDFQPQEGRSTRLERLRSCKPGKEDIELANGKDQAKVVVQYLDLFVASRSGSN
ncbi:hypothetical protein DVH24_020811 [Malus domestica]|uniref:Uncharacterized protein n=1 Tax=Malus domestica TaxID=3750 RepID=A0A498J7Y9_MALDO|nr:hypothetical protein DVH24_020811 [Malus domestica]